MSEKEVLFDIQHLFKYFGKLKTLDDVSLQIHKNEVISIIGPSGAGKSTFLRCLNFLERPEQGIYDFGDLHLDVAKATNEDILKVRRRTCMVFQSFNLFKEMTAQENIEFGLIKVQNKTKAEAEKIATALLKKVGLEDRATHYPAQLSGGQQQRVAIARAVALNPEIILFDEPTSALDPEMIGKVLDVIRDLASEGQTMVIVSHEMNFVRKISDRVVFMAEGAIEEIGTPDEFFDNPKTQRAQQFLAKVLQR